MFPFYNPWKRQKKEKRTSRMTGLTKIQKPGIEKVTQLWFWLLILEKFRIYEKTAVHF